MSLRERDYYIGIAMGKHAAPARLVISVAVAGKSAAVP